MNAVILAGGVGMRLWPMSRSKKPKQFFNVIGNEPLIRDTYRRLLRFFPAEKIFLSISPGFEAHPHEHFPDIPADHIFIEPEKRDTGPAMGYVAALLELQDPDEPLVFIPADHYIGDEELFLRCLAVGEKLVRETGKLVDIGIKPTFPSTVLGYTKIAERIRTEGGIEVFAFAGHREKPPYETAKKFLEDGSYLWHANYYMWTPRRFLEAIGRYHPEAGKILRAIQSLCHSEGAERLKNPEGSFAGAQDDISSLYSALPKISFDYAVTEKMNVEDVLIIRGDFGWSDIGTWDTLYDRLADGEKNLVKGQCVTIDTNGSLIYGPADKLITVVGLDNIVVVDTGDALLVCRRDEAQRVKDLVVLLTQEGHDRYL